MLTLYYRPTCAFCRRVMAVIDRLSLEVEMKDISDEAIAAELEARGGVRQVPYLIDEAQATEMYESDAIVSHLQKYYGVQTAPKVRVHISDNACVSCEG
jgi:glutaredoxin 3